MGKSFMQYAKTLATHDFFIPSIVLAIYLVLVVFIRGQLPSGHQLVALLSSIYDQYGYLIVCISALFESMMILNVFVPGSIGLAMGAVFSRNGAIDLYLVVILATISSTIGYTLDYWLGATSGHKLAKRFGYESTITSIEKQFSRKTFILGLMNPTIGSFFSFAAGTTKFPFATFLPLTLFTTFIWFTIWGILFYMLGELVVETLSKYFFLVIAAGIGGSVLFNYLKKQKD